MNPTTRRTFLQQASAVAVGLGFAGCTSHTEKEKAMEAPQSEGSEQLPKIGVQLWTVREDIEKDLSGTLARVAEIGFDGVETAFWPEGVSLSQGAKALEKAGLSVFSIHCEIPTKEEQARFLEMADAYKCDKMVWHGWPEDPRYATLTGTKELAEIYKESSAFAKSHGLSFGLHNHWWEFEKMKDADQMPFDFLLEELDEDIFFEIDTYWAKVAGRDPAAILKKWGKRAPFLHIKDGPAVHDQPMTAVGKGVQDFPAIARAGHGATEWMIVEIDDCATDMFEAVKESYRYLKDDIL